MEIEQFLDDIKAVIRDGQELLKAGAGGIKEQTLAGLQRTDQLAREFPYGAVGLAFGAGLLAGLLASGWFLRSKEEVTDW